MSIGLLQIIDPRDNLEKATRYELVQFANENGMPEITEHMPAILIRSRLRARGLVNIKIPNRLLGVSGGEMTNFSPPSNITPNEIDANEDLERQFAQQQTDPENMNVGELRAECKRRGVKIARTDNAKIMREKLNGSHAA